MKLYVIPVESLCNGKCSYCITNSRGKIDSEFLNPSVLRKTLQKLDNISLIEITGGGEPFLNKDINEIIRICSEKAPTRLYTNGALVKDFSVLDKLHEVCVSRIHYDSGINKSIMGIEYDITKFVPFNLKLSLLLNKRAICSYKELLNYLEWADSLGVKRVVVREFAERTDSEYLKIFEEQAILIKDILKYLDNRLKDRTPKYQENLFYSFKDTIVEFEVCDCTKQTNGLIVRSDGQVYDDWDSLVCKK